MPNWEKIQNEWETTKITLKALAEKHDVKLGTLKSRRSREKWSRDATGKKDATPTKKMQPKKERYPNGHPGNKDPENQFTERNQSAKKHGLFSRYIPKETMEIMGMLDKDDPADLMWDQIQIQYAAIIRAQQIMFVNDDKDHEEFISKEKEDSFGSEKVYEHHTSWDRHATFMNAQSRAMSELRSLVKQFNELAHDNDERKLKLQLMTAQVDKIKAETENEETGARRVVIVNDKEAMKKAMQDDS